MHITYLTNSFSELTPTRLYDLLQLRAAVFVVEQNCVYQDLDDKDRQAIHLLGYSPAGQLVAYTRLLDIGVSYPEYASIGRVVTAPSVRGQGVGNQLIQEAVAQLYAHFGKKAIKISAQAHLQIFYGDLGFRSVGHLYEEDGIPHRAMIYAGK